MARRAFEVIDVVELLQHWHGGRSKAEVAASVGINRGTVRKYVAAAEAAGLAPGGPPLSRGEWVELVRGWFPTLIDAKARSITYPTINAYRDRIETMLATNTVTTVHQRLRDEHGLVAGISSFRRYVWLEFGDVVSPDAVTVWRPPVTPGSEAQIDYGYLGLWFDPIAARARRVWAFVMVLACSRHMFVRPVLGMDQRSWVAAHVAAFEFFAGTPARLVPDNLKTGVTKPDLYDPKINRAYAEMAAHYGCLIDPARALKPKDKPRVERPMSYVRDSYWRGREWDDVEHMERAALTWCSTIAGRRNHRSLDGAQPLAVFAAIEADELRTLPIEVFELAAWSTPKVHPDCHIKVGKTLYSVPWRNIGRLVDARETERTVEVFLDGALIKTWARLERGKQTDWNDYPPEKVAFFMRTPAWCRRKAVELGDAVVELVNELLEVNALHRLRGAQGVVGLADKYSPERLDEACQRAIDVGDPTYKTVKGILAAGTETTDGDQPTVAPAPPAHLHGPAQLFVVDGEAS